jgi:hypothetical protein
MALNGIEVAAGLAWQGGWVISRRRCRARPLDMLRSFLNVGMHLVLGVSPVQAGRTLAGLVWQQMS